MTAPVSFADAGKIDLTSKMLFNIIQSEVKTQSWFKECQHQQTVHAQTYVQLQL